MVVGHADVVAALVATRSVDLKLNRVTRNVRRWMAAHRLSLVLNKTEVVILTKNCLLYTSRCV